jgi:hypothetical protein
VLRFELQPFWSRTMNFNKINKMHGAQPNATEYHEAIHSMRCDVACGLPGLTVTCERSSGVR